MPHEHEQIDDFLSRLYGGELPQRIRRYPKRTEQNVIDSDGTIIFSHGALTGGSKLTRKLANKHQKPCLHINFHGTPDYNTVFLVRKWMFENDVEILNVAGPRASGDPEIYDAVFKVIKGVYWTDKIKSRTRDTDRPSEALGNPKTVDEAVDQILAEFLLRNQVDKANMVEEDLAIFQAVLAKFIGDKLDEWSVIQLMPAIRRLKVSGMKTNISTDWTS